MRAASFTSLHFPHDPSYPHFFYFSLSLFPACNFQCIFSTTYSSFKTSSTSTIRTSHISNNTIQHIRHRQGGSRARFPSAIAIDFHPLVGTFALPSPSPHSTLSQQAPHSRNPPHTLCLTPSKVSPSTQQQHHQAAGFPSISITTPFNSESAIIDASLCSTSQLTLTRFIFKHRPSVSDIRHPALLTRPSSTASSATRSV